MIVKQSVEYVCIGRVSSQGRSHIPKAVVGQQLLNSVRDAMWVRPQDRNEKSSNRSIVVMCQSGMKVPPIPCSYCCPRTDLCAASSQSRTESVSGSLASDSTRCKTVNGLAIRISIQHQIQLGIFRDLAQHEEGRNRLIDLIASSCTPNLEWTPQTGPSAGQDRRGTDGKRVQAHVASMRF